MPSRVVCAPDSFKGTVHAARAAHALARGVEAAGAVAVTCPVADGGEGTLDILIADEPGAVRMLTVTGPHGEPVHARFGLLARGVAVVELAEAAGLTLVPETGRDPERTTTYGVGELLRAAIDAGSRDLVLAVGGSATCDGGVGLAQALGARFFDAAGHELPRGIAGGELVRVARVEPAPPLRARLRVACDVTNPLVGPRGAAAVYAPQKGATPDQVARLEAGLRNLAERVGGDPDAAGAGASGGAAYGAAALLGAELVRGAELVLDVIGFDERVRGADVVITGEGRLDAQSADGKACTTVARRARGARTVAIVGVRGEGWERCVQPEGDIENVVDLTEMFGERAMRAPEECLEEAARTVVRGPGAP